MPRVCTACSHERADEIDSAILSPMFRIRDIARRFGLKKDAVWRHSAHLPEKLVIASEAREMAKADRLLLELDDLKAESWRQLDKADEKGDVRAATSSIREARSCIDSMFRVAEVIQRQAYQPSDVEWWSRQLIGAFQAQLADVSTGKLAPDVALQNIIDQAEQLLSAGPEGARA